MARKKGAHQIRSFYTPDKNRLARLKSGGVVFDAEKRSPGIELVCLRDGNTPDETVCQYFKTGIEMVGLLKRSGGRREGICTGECAWRIYDKE